ncbi:hypothetical protein JX265_003119 [Neoarthrinium moseri]|uniref:Peptidase S8/S53 domain-containing protein n=1 Tax=Neoarthrinium moseri TaxID=1658444 RepID=A0A9P9WTA6_9PEZI|nr:hypothetical protein JX265_003119 [Neoarthrinium moseri]
MGEKEAKALKASRVDEKGAKAAKDTKTSSPATKKSKRTSAEDILTAAASTDFTKPNEAQEWRALYKEKLVKKPGNQILHVLANKDKWPKEMVWEDTQTTYFLDWMLERHHGLLEVKDDDQYTPLHRAIMKGNNAFVEAVLQNEKLINLGTVLPETCQYGNSLHVAIKYGLPSIELMVDKCAKFSQMFSKGQSETNNTPLHSCMSIDLDEERGDEDESDEEDGDGDDDDDDENEDDLSNRDEHDRNGIGAGHVDLREAKNLGCVVSNGEKTGLRKPRNVDLRSPTDIQRRGSQSLSRRTKSFPTPPITDSTKRCARVVDLLIKKHASVLSLTNGAGLTPYQERVARLKEKFIPFLNAKTSDTAREKSEREIIASDPVASNIRSYCVRSTDFSRDKVMEALYHPGQERHIEFDLGGLPHATISEDYLDRLSKHLQFESILKYVALPKLILESHTVRRIGGEKRPRRKGLSHLVTVFNWLRKNHVEKIVKVIVIDDEDPSHADASIEEALSGLGVEIWDWKRLDLSTDVIWRATTAPGNKDVSVVREISLYSTGNNSVLMGWASPEGLANKKKFPYLKKVNLFIREGLEDNDRLERYIEDFKEAIGGQTADNIEINHILDNKHVSYASDFKNSEGSLQPENSWIDCMSSFAKFLRRAPAARNTRPVKVAIIDDGVDASLLSLDGKIAIGKSFCPYANSRELMSPYYVPSGNHGTCMATLISKICPEVSLYVARLDERQTPGTSYRQITAKSAADAIRWATESGVHIISMSWTIETPVTGNEDMESLKAAVREAANKNILMFCSTSDQGSSTKDSCYPGDFDGCIKIGGATDTGEALAWVNAGKVDFLLPGKNVPFTSNEGKIVSYESGSSVATAAASALAGLFLFSSWLLNKEDDELKDQKNMREAFKNLSSDTKFPRVQDYFDHRFKMVLSREGKANESSRKPKGSTASYNLQNMEWNANCDTALAWIIGLIKGKP